MVSLLLWFKTPYNSMSCKTMRKCGGSEKKSEKAGSLSLRKEN
ncbi:Uncharacterized protein dnm_075630 [Desulfonema magnum]|uniref:Uncharacterized protein n=1 Tax=Desulfonema magnum TaxID=45655 RepID=A0A975BUP8_9BACT|nr:Uncharacterized protein dnm_075630 [Desulfonema magnum]